MFRKLYSKVIGKSFFTKIIVFFSAVVTVSLLILSGLISTMVSEQYAKKELEYESQVLKRVMNYVESKENEFRRIIFNLYYINGESYTDILNYLGTDSDNLEDSTKRNIESYLNLISNTDADILDMALYKELDGSICTIAKTSRILSLIYDYESQPWFQKIRQNGNKMTFIPTYKPDYVLHNTDNVFTIGINLYDRNDINLNGIGTLFINYNPKNFNNVLKDTKLNGSVLILTNDGSVVFNSDGEYIGQKLPYFDRLDISKKTLMLDREYMVDYVKSPENELLYVSMIPAAVIRNAVDKIQNMIYISLVFILAFAIILTITGTKVFSRRVAKITDSMHKLESGRFDMLIKTSGEDEIDEIANSFNKMCTRLEKHINESFISQIRQKNAELAALQTQINPHFLFNTLESMRVMAEKSNNPALGEMICGLSSMFRWNMKNKDNTVTVREELAHLKIYLELLKLRLGDRLEFSVDVDESILEYQITKFTFQPIVENAIKHGIESIIEGGTVSVKGFKAGPLLVFEVVDDGKGMDEASLKALNDKLKSDVKLQTDKIGLKNVHDRMRMLFGSSYGLEIKSGGRGVVILISIPAVFKEELDVQAGNN